VLFILNVYKSIEGETKGSIYQGEMGKYKVSLLLLWVFFALCTLLVLKVEARAYSSSLERQIEAKLKLLNKPAVKSIKVCNFIYSFFF
jgi:hypothetical protein